MIAGLEVFQNLKSLHFILFLFSSLCERRNLFLSFSFLQPSASCLFHFQLCQYKSSPFFFLKDCRSHSKEFLLVNQLCLWDILFQLNLYQMFLFDSYPWCYSLIMPIPECPLQQSTFGFEDPFTKLYRDKAVFSFSNSFWFSYLSLLASKFQKGLLLSIKCISSCKGLYNELKQGSLNLYSPHCPRPLQALSLQDALDTHLQE